MFNRFPYTNFHNLNLDWIIGKIKKAVFSVNGLIPDDSGNVVIPTVPTVSSVNGQQGAVVLDATDVGAIPDTVTVPTLTSQLVNDSGYITAAQASAVTSVNGQTGDVVLTASDVGAVSSVNGNTGAVILTAADVGAVSFTETVSGDWIVRTWSNGLVEAWAQKEMTFVCTNAYGPLFVNNVVQNTIALPSVISNVRFKMLSLSEAAQSGIVCVFNLFATDPMDIGLVTVASGTYTVKVDVYVKGSV